MYERLNNLTKSNYSQSATCVSEVNTMENNNKIKREIKKENEFLWYSNFKCK